MQSQKDKKEELNVRAIPSHLNSSKKKKCTCGVANPSKPKFPVGIRRIKIQPKFVQRVWEDKLVPQILLRGEWLRKNGFECAGHVLVMEEQGKLVIQLESGL